MFLRGEIRVVFDICNCMSSTDLTFGIVSYIREYKTIANSVVENSKCYKCILCVLLVHQILLSVAASTGPKLIMKNEK